MKGIFVNIARSVALSLEDVSKNIVKSLVSSFGIFFLIAFLVLYMSVRESVKNYVDKNIFGTLAIDEIRITPKPPKASGSFDAFSATNTAGGIKLSVVNAVKKMPEVKKTYTLIEMENTSFIQGELMGKKQKVYLPIGTIENDFFRDRNPKWKNMYAGKVIPLVAPNLAIDMLNNLLVVKGYPPMPAASLKGFPVELGVQSTPRDYEPKKTYTYEAVLHDITDDLPFSGVIAPREFIAKFYREHGADATENRPGLRYKLMYVKVNDIKKLPETTAYIKKMGVNVESQQDVAAKTNKALDIIDGSSMLIIGMFLILTVISIFNSYLTIVYNRSQKFSLRRVLGVPKYHIIMGFVIEASLVGALYGLGGYFAGNALMTTFADYVGKFVPSLKGIIVQSVDSKGLLFIAIFASAAISSLSALIPAFFAANMNLFKAMRK
jgi:ABC-type lipoprotein release transport system permease subunit